MLRKANERSAFSLIELVVVIVILAILAGVAIPRLSSGADRARDSVLVGNKRALQDAMERYAAEHLGRSPAHNADGSVNLNGVVVEQRLTGRTDEGGTVLGSGVFGPYLREIPRNPVNRMFSIRVDGAPPGAGTHGWHVSSATGRVMPDHVTSTGGPVMPTNNDPPAAAATPVGGQQSMSAGDLEPS